MKKVWVLLAGRSHAKILEYQKDEGLNTLQEISHPEGRLKNKDLDSDRQSVTYTQATGKTSVYSKEVDATEKLAVVFAKELTKLLVKGFNEHAYETLVLVAEPHFLGHLRKQLHFPTSKIVIKSLDKDLSHLRDRQLLQKLQEEKILS